MRNECSKGLLSDFARKTPSPPHQPPPHQPPPHPPPPPPPQPPPPPPQPPPPPPPHPAPLPPQPPPPPPAAPPAPQAAPELYAPASACIQVSAEIELTAPHPYALPRPCGACTHPLALPPRLVAHVCTCAITPPLHCRTVPGIGTLAPIRALCAIVPIPRCPCSCAVMRSSWHPSAVLPAAPPPLRPASAPYR
ncbi:hypothetical protein EVG20_g4173 [Dentipellis fragilis]|uniref:Uncharacterized protein n=1 Tax=Dentipellis fragilis TaxID=205917 RepID=A0A4Y9YXE4_9AGAM|nr:hypothetical protein EVG20_g4173 [Dentipellis fragilis]